MKMGESGSHKDEEKTHHEHHEGGLLSSNKLFYALAIAVFAVLAFNQLQLSSLNVAAASQAILLSSQQQQLAAAQSQAATQAQPAAAAQVQSAAAAAPAQAGSTINLQELADKVIPQGVPAIYGTELGVTYSDPVNSMNILAALDDGKGLPDPVMNQRYVSIASQMACEYCCGANTLIAGDGSAACACAHSYAMRGLAKYLVVKRGSEFTDEQILAELGKWKTLFFPKQILTKAIEFSSAGKDISIIDLTSNEFRGFKAPAQAASGGQSAVGNIANLPNMVGGC